MNVISESQALKSNKFLVIGDSQCGRTSILNYYCNPDKSPQKVPRTIGCDIHLKELLTNTDGVETAEYVEFWDINTDSIPQAILQAYLQPTLKEIDSLKGIIFFFDIFNIKSFLRLRKYLEELVVYLLEHKRMVLSPDDESVGIPLLVVGSKRDLVDDESALKKMAMIKDYLKLIFNQNAKISCEFLSIYYEYSQFKEFENFIRCCVKGDLSDLQLYQGPQTYYSYDKLSAYKEKIWSLGKDLTRMKDYLYSQKSNISSYVTALVNPPKFFDVYRLVWRDWRDWRA